MGWERFLLAPLVLNRGRTFTEVAKIVGVTKQSTSIWAKKHKETGWEMLTDKPRPGRPTVIEGLQRAKITALACSEPPEGYARWSLRLLADKAVALEMVESISYGQVRLILKNKLKPRLKRYWCISKISSRFLAKMEQILKLYAYEKKGLVLC